MASFPEMKLPAELESTMAVAETTISLIFRVTLIVNGEDTEGFGKTELTIRRGGRDGQVRMK